jgi:hypothetical protein
LHWEKAAWPPRRSATISQPQDPLIATDKTDHGGIELPARCGGKVPSGARVARSAKDIHYVYPARDPSWRERRRSRLPSAQDILRSACRNLPVSIRPISSRTPMGGRGSTGRTLSARPAFDASPGKGRIVPDLALRCRPFVATQLSIFRSQLRPVRFSHSGFPRLADPDQWRARP